ncbi:MAG: hypothetical protein ACLPTF_14870 [Steroidobacteraceae bacterium]
MYRWLLIVHSDWRWVVVAVGFITLIHAGSSLSASAPWQPNGARVARLFGIALDIQVLLGAALYLTFSPLTNVVLSTASAGTSTSFQIQYFASIHPAIMVTAFLVAHIASSVVKRARDEASRARRALIGYGLTWLIVMAGVPWFRPWERL